MSFLGYMIAFFIGIAVGFLVAARMISRDLEQSA